MDTIFPGLKQLTGQRSRFFSQAGMSENKKAPDNRGYKYTLNIHPATCFKTEYHRNHHPPEANRTVKAILPLVVLVY